MSRIFTDAKYGRVGVTESLDDFVQAEIQARIITSFYNVLDSAAVGLLTVMFYLNINAMQVNKTGLFMVELNPIKPVTCFVRSSIHHRQ